MSLPATIAPAILDTVIGRLALLFLTGAASDMPAAREAASEMLAAYNVETPEELTLAAAIISFRFHTLEALSYAFDPDLPLSEILRLRGGAVGLSRESHKAQRKLDQLQRARRTGLTIPAESQQPQRPTTPKVEEALDLVEAAREAIQIAKKTGGKNWSQSLQKRLTAQRMADKMKKKQAEYAQQHPPAPSPQATAAP